MADENDRKLDLLPVNRDPHPAEWAIGTASAIAIVVLIGYLGFTALTESDAPPALEPRVDEIVQAGDGWHVRLTVMNTGDKTAADVVLRGEAGNQESETTFDYVPAGSSRHGALLFDAEPADLSLSVRSYQEP